MVSSVESHELGGFGEVCVIATQASAERYTLQDAGKGHLIDEYVQVIFRHGPTCDIIGHGALIHVWKNLDEQIRQLIRQPSQDTTFDDFSQLLEERIEHHSTVDKQDIKHDEKEAAYQRGLKAG